MYIFFPQSIIQTELFSVTVPQSRLHFLLIKSLLYFIFYTFNLFTHSKHFCMFMSSVELKSSLTSKVISRVNTLPCIKPLYVVTKISFTAQDQRLNIVSVPAAELLMTQIS